MQKRRQPSHTCRASRVAPPRIRILYSPLGGVSRSVEIMRFGGKRAKTVLNNGRGLRSRQSTASRWQTVDESLVDGNEQRHTKATTTTRCVFAHQARNSPVKASARSFRHHGVYGRLEEAICLHRDRRSTSSQENRATGRRHPELHRPPANSPPLL